MHIVTDHVPICWKCGETSQFSSCPEEKTAGIQTQTPHLAVSVISVSPMMSMPETEIGVGKSTVGSRSPKILCSPLQRLWRKKRENCWLLVVSEGSVRKLHLSPLKPPRSKVRIAPFPLLALKATSRIHKPFHFNNCKRNIILVIKK